MSGLLLDTCAVIWSGSNRLPREVVERVDASAARGEVYYSPVSAWEIGLLGRSRRDGPRLRFDPNPVAWFNAFRSAPGLREIPLSADIALAAALLSGDIHTDPADRFLIATALAHNLPLLTSDRRLIDYGAQGILDVIAYRPEPDAPA